MTDGVGQNSDEPALVIRQDTLDEDISVLLKEYELALNRFEGSNNRALQVLGAGIGVLSIIAGYVLSPGNNLSFTFAWIAPLICMLVFFLLMFVTYLAIADVWVCRLLSRRINLAVGEPALITYDVGLPNATFFSSRHGNIKLRLLYGLLILGCVVLYFIVAVAAFATIYSASHVAGSAYLLLYIFLLLVGITCTSGIFYDLPRFYDAYFSELNRTGHMPKAQEYAAVLRSSLKLQSALTWILPRPWDFFAKCLVFVLGFVAALVIVGPLPSQLPILNFLFSDTHAWMSVGDIPILALIALGAVYFIAEEGVLQQAKLLWDDIRDVDRDKHLLLNKNRPLASGVMSVSGATYHVFIRWVIAILVSYLIGGLALLALFILISLHQVIYVLWAKPKAAQHPVQLLLVISFNLPLRFLAGAMVITGPTWSLAPIMILFTLFYFLSFGSMAAQWKMEAQYQKEIDQSVSVRPQSKFYLKHGTILQHIGFLATIFSGCTLLVAQMIASNCSTDNASIAMWYGHCASGTSVVHYAGYNIGSAILFIVGSIIVVLAIVAPVVLLGRLVGALALLITGSLLALMAFPMLVCQIMSMFTQSSSCAANVDVAALLQNFAVWNSIGLAGKIGVCIALASILVFISRIIGPWVRKGVLILKIVFLIAMIAVCIGNFVDALWWNDSIGLIWGFIVLGLSYLLLFEDMTYLEYTLAELRARLPLIMRSIYYYVFSSTSDIHLLDILKLMFQSGRVAANLESVRVDSTTKGSLNGSD